MEPPKRTHEFHELLEMIEELKKRVGRIESTGSTKRPTLEAVKLYAAKMGLPEDQAEWFFNFYQSNGWRVGRNPMKSWESAMINWRRNWQSKGHGADKGRALTMFEMKLALEAKQARAKELSDKYYNDSGAFHEWTSLPARIEYIAIKKSIKQLIAKIAGAA